MIVAQTTSPDGSVLPWESASASWLDALFSFPEEGESKILYAMIVLDDGTCTVFKQSK